MDPRTDPQGTPHNKIPASEKKFSEETKNSLLDRSDSSQLQNFGGP